jgi:Secretion system C-terminal sorting domain
MRFLRFFPLFFLLCLISQLSLANSPTAVCTFDIKVIQPCNKYGVTIIEYCFKGGKYCPNEQDFWLAEGANGAQGEFIDANGNSLGSIIHGPLYGFNNCVRVRWTVTPNLVLATGTVTFVSGLEEGTTTCCLEAYHTVSLSDCAGCSVTYSIPDKRTVCFTSTCSIPYCIKFTIRYTNGEIFKHMFTLEPSPSGGTATTCFYITTDPPMPYIVEHVTMQIAPGKCKEGEPANNDINANNYVVVVDAENDRSKSVVHTNDVQIFPNPVSNEEVNIVLPLEYNIEQGVQITLTDITGKVIKTQAASSHTVMVPLNGIPNGIYLVSIKSYQGSVTKTLVVNSTK